MVSNSQELERRLWEAADQLRANSKLRVGEYSVPVQGLIFLKYADTRFEEATNFLSGMTTGRRQTGPLDYQARGVLYLPKKARYSHLVNLPEGENIGQAINDAMKLIESENAALKDVLPKTYNRMENFLLVELLRIFNSIPMDIEGDMFGRIYEYFLGKFAAAEGQRGGEFFTPTSIVKLIVEIIEPYYGRILDPACGSGGMFVQSAYFVDQHQGNPGGDISIYGQEKTTQTVRLAKMNLAVHGLEGDIRSANSYYEDPHKMLGRFDFVMANPPFNVDGVDFERVKGDPRLPFGIPTVDNANYLWIQYFYSALNDEGRAGFVMANSASDARHSEQIVREKLVQSGAVDVMVAVGSNFFHNVTLPCTLWFLDRGVEGNGRKDTVLFIDARKIFAQIDRAHREFSDEQLEFIANIARLYRGEEPELWRGSEAWLYEVFPEGVYQDVAGLCKVAEIKEIKAQGWSLNPGRYVGVAAREDDDGFDFIQTMTELYERLELLNAEAHELEERISENMLWLLENGGE
jgi:type I restriction enzyme M protein